MPTLTATPILSTCSTQQIFFYLDTAVDPVSVFLEELFGKLSVV